MKRRPVRMPGRISCMSALSRFSCRTQAARTKARVHPGTRLAVPRIGIFRLVRDAMGDRGHRSAVPPSRGAWHAVLGCSVTLKVETLNPVRSFKGRGTETVAAVAHKKGAARMVCASAGNLGAALAYYDPVRKQRGPSRLRALGARTGDARRALDSWRCGWTIVQRSLADRLEGVLRCYHLPTKDCICTSDLEPSC